MLSGRFSYIFVEKVLGFRRIFEPPDPDRQCSGPNLAILDRTSLGTVPPNLSQLTTYITSTNHLWHPQSTFSYVTSHYVSHDKSQLK